MTFASEMERKGIVRLALASLDLGHAPYLKPISEYDPTVRLETYDQLVTDMARAQRASRGDDDVTLFDAPPVPARFIPARPLSYGVRPVARDTDPDTSWEAAASVGDVSVTQARIIALYQRFGDLTDEELQEHWDAMIGHGYPPISASGLRSRRSELVRAGKVVDSGKRGLSAAGRQAAVWALGA